ncbi:MULTISPECIES: hypothetical protein [Streptomyces]|uniref:hypothetical protein n=1 Tax=Streptomyces TaxID=1883 RepID=UPI002F950234
MELFTAGGLNPLLAQRQATRAHGLPLALVSPGRAVRHAAAITGPADLFTVRATIDEAATRPHR